MFGYANLIPSLTLKKENMNLFMPSLRNSGFNAYVKISGITAFAVSVAVFETQQIISLLEMLLIL